MALDRKTTVFPNGINILPVAIKGGTAGSHTVPAGFGVEVGDVIGSVVAIKIATNGAITTAQNLTSEFTSPIAAANAIANTGGTNTTGQLLFAIIYDQNPDD